MLVNRSMPFAFFVLVAVGALGCSDQGPRWEPEVITEVAVVGQVRNVTVGQTLQFDGRALTNLGNRRDDAVTWSVSNGAIISVTSQVSTVNGITVNRATVTGLAVGAADLIATASQVSSQVRVTVNPTAP